MVKINLTADQDPLETDIPAGPRDGGGDPGVQDGVVGLEDLGEDDGLWSVRLGMVLTVTPPSSPELTLITSSRGSQHDGQ